MQSLEFILTLSFPQWWRGEGTCSNSGWRLAKEREGERLAKEREEEEKKEGEKELQGGMKPTSEKLHVIGSDVRTA